MGKMHSSLATDSAHKAPVIDIGSLLDEVAPYLALCEVMLSVLLDQFSICIDIQLDEGSTWS